MHYRTIFSIQNITFKLNIFGLILRFLILILKDLSIHLKQSLLRFMILYPSLLHLHLLNKKWFYSLLHGILLYPFVYLHSWMEKSGGLWMLNFDLKDFLNEFILQFFKLILNWGSQIFWLKLFHQDLMLDILFIRFPNLE